MKRFELDPPPWQGDALPLSYIRVVLGFTPRDLLSMQHRGSLGQAKRGGESNQGR